VIGCFFLNTVYIVFYSKIFSIFFVIFLSFSRFTCRLDICQILSIRVK